MINYIIHHSDTIPYDLEYSPTAPRAPQDLGNLSKVLTDAKYKVANAGLSYDYQFIDVEERGSVVRSTSTPVRHLCRRYE